jgi:small-conductance mechanosensitive channel
VFSALRGRAWWLANGTTATPSPCSGAKDRLPMNLLATPRAQLVLGTFLVTALLAELLRRLLKRRGHEEEAKDHSDRRLFGRLLHKAIGPVTLLIWYYGLYGMAHLALSEEWLGPQWQWVDPGLRHITSIGITISFLWFFYRSTVVVDEHLRRIATRTASRVDDVILPLIGTTLRVTVPILAVFTLLRLWPIPDSLMNVIRKLLTIALIAAVTWVVRRAILLVDAAVLGRAEASGNYSIDQRALATRVRLLRRIATALVTVIAFATVLMTFEEVRDIGKSILASAGVAGIVLGIAAQSSLGNIFAGVQIALTQPIRLGDQVQVEGDVGNIEELTLTYVVVRVWDGRRIVLPISYFIQKPFQNWTRGQTNMLTPVPLRVDFSLPVEELRRYMQQEIAKSPFWDKRVFNVQVTNADAQSMEVRVLGSASDPGASGNLQMELREKMITFIREKYPQCLPKIRQEQHKIERWSNATDGDRPMVAGAAPKPADPRARS